MRVAVLDGLRCLVRAVAASPRLRVLPVPLDLLLLPAAGFLVVVAPVGDRFRAFFATAAVFISAVLELTRRS